MNKTLGFVGSLLIFLSVSCEKLDDIQQGCTIRVSEKVFKGDFAAEDVTCIRIINGVTQQTLYPLPDWRKSKNMSEIHNPTFFKEFKESIIAAGWKKCAPSEVHITGNIQIKVSFKKGPGAYLFCRPSNHQLGVCPMFEHDSYGNANEPLFQLINNTLGSTVPTATAPGATPGTSSN